MGWGLRLRRGYKIIPHTHDPRVYISLAATDPSRSNDISYSLSAADMYPNKRIQIQMSSSQQTRKDNWNNKETAGTYARRFTH
jgi:hypothetical protein